MTETHQPAAAEPAACNVPMRRWIPAFLVLLTLPVMVPAQERAAAQQVFGRTSEAVVKVQVTETGSAAKASLGSGFFATSSGHVITNYHVIAQLVHDPDRYRIELFDAVGASVPARVVAVDVVHDLAVLAAERRPQLHLELQSTPLRNGARLFALGHPHDLGLSIVDGTFNGLLEHTLYPKIHFTGSLNAGMSGGPAVTSMGAVVGVNVSTMGNQISFLVPARYAAALLERARHASPSTDEAELLAEVAAQIRTYQAEYTNRMFSDSMPTVQLGRFVVPTQPAPFFRCWADSDSDREAPYRSVVHQCSTDDVIYISDTQRSGIVELRHRHLSTRELNPFRFFSLYSSRFGNDYMPAGDDVTLFKCETRNVRRDGIVLRTQLCVRRYRKLEGLYDATLTAAVLGDASSGLVTSLKLAGVSYDTLERLTRRYLESISWIE